MTEAASASLSDPQPAAVPTDLARQLVAEGLGTALLLAVIIGSGIMGDRLAGGNAAVALLGTTLSTGAALVVLITILGPLSGAHFNPAVTLAVLLRREIRPRVAGLFVLVQTLLQVSTKLRDGPAQMLSEFIATFGLLATILGSIRFNRHFVPVAVGLYITSAYWFTASTSFANPAVTLARSLSDTFAGIAPASVPWFLAAQVAGTLAAVWLFGWLLKEERTP